MLGAFIKAAKSTCTGMEKLKTRMLGFQHCTMCTLDSFFSFRPRAVGHIVSRLDSHNIEHIFVPTLSVERNNEKIRLQLQEIFYYRGILLSNVHIDFSLREDRPLYSRPFPPTVVVPFLSAPPPLSLDSNVLFRSSA